MVDNTTNANEYLLVYATDGTNQCKIDSISSAMAGGFHSGYIGVVSPVSIKKIYFSENNDGDEIGVKHFYFGYKPE